MTPFLGLDQRTNGSRSRRRLVPAERLCYEPRLFAPGQRPHHAENMPAVKFQDCLPRRDHFQAGSWPGLIEELYPAEYIPENIHAFEETSSHLQTAPADNISIPPRKFHTHYGINALPHRLCFRNRKVETGGGRHHLRTGQFWRSRRSAPPQRLLPTRVIPEQGLSPGTLNLYGRAEYRKGCLGNLKPFRSWRRTQTFVKSR